MADVAATQLLQSAAPGHFDEVAQNLGKLGAKFSNLDALKLEHQLSMGIGANKASASVSNPIAQELKEKLLAYQQKAFGASASVPTRGIAAKKVNARVWLLPGPSSSVFQICSYAEKMDTQNLQTGFWKSTWTITNTTGVEAQVKGTIEIHTYAYEDGNTQLQLSKTFDGQLVEPHVPEGVEEDPTLANGILYQIVEWEHEVLSLLMGLHELSGNCLRKIRRVLPITKTRMNWEVEAQRGVKHLKKTAKR